MNFVKYSKATWINMIKKFSKYGKLQDLQEKDNICEITFKVFDYFPFNCELRYAIFYTIPTWYELQIP